MINLLLKEIIKLKDSKLITETNLIKKRNIQSFYYRYDKKNFYKISIILKKFCKNEHFHISENNTFFIFIYDNNIFYYINISLNSKTIKSKNKNYFSNMVISGPDGVGKSYIINKLKYKFKSFNDFINFDHHISSIKSNKKLTSSFLFRVLNFFSLGILNIFIFKFIYQNNLNKIFSKKNNFSINIIERSYFDRFIIFKILNKNYMAFFISKYLFSYPKPNIVMLLDADSNKIYSLKQELPLHLISSYNLLLERYLKKKKIKYYLIKNSYDQIFVNNLINIIIKSNLKLFINKVHQI